MHNSTLLHRQVHPAWVQDNQLSSQVFETGVTNIPTGITSQVFAPTPKDENKLSVYNGEKFSAEEAYNHYVLELESAGVVSVTVEEANSTTLQCVEDNVPFDGHSYIDFADLGTNQVKAKAKILKNFANKRNWTFRNTL
ncbi:hypothetical protein ABIC45_001236 [Mucilaginibacter rubeus]|uniref:hypothetical protein n=1 Tax=Mucilaginibacter rubeus TaxID=2027860 RepID=UPI00339862FC